MHEVEFLPDEGSPFMELLVELLVFEASRLQPQEQRIVLEGRFALVGHANHRLEGWFCEAAINISEWLRLPLCYKQTLAVL